MICAKCVQSYRKTVNMYRIALLKHIYQYQVRLFLRSLRLSVALTILSVCHLDCVSQMNTNCIFQLLGHEEKKTIS